ncbi:hypothetical protein [Hydrotalea sp.]|nr:hypothetical protein [Hydrotalea sp.]
MIALLSTILCRRCNKLIQFIQKYQRDKVAEEVIAFNQIKATAEK